MDSIAELKKRAQTNPQSLSKKEWDAICTDAFGAPKKELAEESKVSSSGPGQKRKEWW